MAYTRYRRDEAWADTSYVTPSNPLPVVAGSISQFDEAVTVERTPIIQLLSSDGPTLLRNVITTSNGATVTAADTGEILIQTDDQASSVGRLDSAERLRYIPGYGAELGHGIRIPDPLTGTQEAKWGIRKPDGSDGFYFKATASEVSVEVIRDDVVMNFPQSEWNIDKLDGEGPSRINLDLSSGTIFQIDFTHYGYGDIVFGIIRGVRGKQKFWPCHWVKVEGQTSLRTPTLPLFNEASNGAGADGFALYVGGRQGSVVGKYIPKFRPCSQENAATIATSTSPVPLITFRDKVGFEDKSVNIFAALAEVTDQNHIIEFYLNASLTGASYGNPTNKTASETALEVDTSATALTGGIWVYDFVAAVGEKNKEGLVNAALKFDIPENQPITMAARTVTGTGSVTLAWLQMQEEF